MINDVEHLVIFLLAICIFGDMSNSRPLPIFLIKKNFFFKFIWQTEITSRQRGRRREREEEAGSLLSREPGAGLDSQDLETMTWAEGRGLTHWAIQAPQCAHILKVTVGPPGWLSELSLWLLILAQVMISGSWDPALHRALCSAGSLLPPLSLSACLSAYLWSLSVK